MTIPFEVDDPVTTAMASAHVAACDSSRVVASTRFSESHSEATLRLALRDFIEGRQLLITVRRRCWIKCL